MRKAELQERDGELGRLRGLADRALVGDGTVVLVEGVVGIGKTALLMAARTEAKVRFATVLSARGGTVERGLAWGGVRDIFLPLLPSLDDAGRDELFSGAAGWAAEVLGLERQRRQPPGDTAGPALHGLYWLVVALAQRNGSLALFIDDAHWLDEPSLRWLTYLARRLDGLPVLLVLAVRSGDPGAATAGRLLMDAGTAELVSPPALTRNGTEAILTAVLEADPAPEFLDACHATTGGNPLLVTQLADALGRDGVNPGTEAAALVPEFHPAMVARSALIRLHHLSDQAWAVARSVAVLGEPARLDDVAKLSEIDLAAAGTASDELVQAGLLSSSTELVYVHPILRAAVYDDLAPHQRSRLQLRAAELVSEAGRSAELVASHLLVVAPFGDQWVVERLREAATRAQGRGAPESAVRYLQRALEEPCAEADRCELLTSLGIAQYAAGQPENAFSSMERALVLEADEGRRVGLAFALSSMHGILWTGHGVSIMETMLAELPPGSPLAVHVEIETLAKSLTHSDRFADAAPRLWAMRTKIEADKNPIAIAELAIAGAGLLMPADQVAALALQSIELGLAERRVFTANGFAGMSLTFGERFGDAESFWGEEIESARQTGSPLRYAIASEYRAINNLRRGRVREAEDDCKAAVRLLEERDMPAMEPRGYLAQILVEQDEAAEAVAILELLAPAPGSPHMWNHAVLSYSRGEALIATGQPEAALRELTDCDRPHSVYHANPSILPWRSASALAHAQLGDSDEATRLAREEVGLARQWGTPRATGRALVTLGLVTGGRDGVETLREAYAVLENSGALLELARCQVELGATLRRTSSRREARDWLQQGLSDAVACGSLRLRRRARDELRVLGARPRRDALRGRDALTASESRVALMAAGGLTNSQIAQDLFVTPKTVETHLSHAYAKLNITGRSQLSETHLIAPLKEAAAEPQ